MSRTKRQHPNTVDDVESKRLPLNIEDNDLYTKFVEYRLPLIVQGAVDGWKEVTVAVGVLVSHPTFELLGHINLRTFRLPCQQFTRQYSSTA